MLTTEVGKKVVDRICEYLVVNEGDIKLESTLERDLESDMLDRMELFCALEEDFNIFINDDDEEKIITVKDLIKTIERLRQE